MHLDSSERGGEKPEPGAAGAGNPGEAPGSVSLVINKGRRLAARVGLAGVGAPYIFLREGGRPQWPGTISISHRNPRRGCLGKPPPTLQRQFAVRCPFDANGFTAFLPGPGGGTVPDPLTCTL